MSFKMTAELFQALLDGKKIRLKEWSENTWVEINAFGFFHDNEGSRFPTSDMETPTLWELYTEPKKLVPHWPAVRYGLARNNTPVLSDALYSEKSFRPLSEGDRLAKEYPPIMIEEDGE